MAIRGCAAAIRCFITSTSRKRTVRFASSMVTPRTASSPSRFASAAVLLGSAAVGSVIALGSDVAHEWAQFQHDDDCRAAASAPAQATRTLTTLSGRRMRVFDSHWHPQSTSTGTVLILADSITLLAHIADAISSSHRVVCLEPVADVTGTAIATDAADVADVCTQLQLNGSVVVLTSALAWPAALQFAERNVTDIAGLVLLDPLLPTSAIVSSTRTGTNILPLRTWDPLHVLEHVLTGSAHHHMFCGMDHAFQAAPATAPKSPQQWVTWRADSSASRASSVPEPEPLSDDVDTLEPATVHLERLYRDRLGDGSHPVALVEMIPSFSQSVLPSLYRGFSALGWHRDARMDQLDAAVHALHHDVNMSAATARIRTLAAALPVHVRITIPEEAAVREPRWDPRQSAVVPPSSVEVELRERLLLHAHDVMAFWQSQVPGRVGAVPSASAAGSHHSMLDARADCVAGLVDRLMKAR